MNNEIQIRTEPGEIAEFGSSKFGMMMTLANRLAGSKLVPQQFRGAPEDIYLALDMAERLDMNPLMVMQSLYIVQGKPAWSSQFVIACINASRRYTPLRFRIKRDKDDHIISCQCVANDRATGEELTGAKITAEMVRSEGWDTKAGSKWKTMPEQMFRYRSASFFARVHCPEVTLGIYSADEVREFTEPAGPEADMPTAENGSRSGSLPSKEAAVTISPDYEPDIKVADYAQRMHNAATMSDLQAIEIEIGTDNKLGAADRDFLRPIAAGKRKEFDK